MNFKKIYINESQFSLLGEGVTVSPRANQTINFKVNQDKSDVGNKDYADTRFFGKRGDIANGDGTYRVGKYKGSFNKSYELKKDIVDLYRVAIDIVTNERYDEAESLIDSSSCDTHTKGAIKRILFSDMSSQDKIDRIEAAITRNQNSLNVIKGKYDRLNADGVSDEDTMPRYNVGLVPNTNVKFIGLFEIKDFNFSDAIKHGAMRANNAVRKMVGDTPTIDKLGSGVRKEKAKVSYDDTEVTPDVAGNFSLKGIETNPFNVNRNNGHYKQQYGYNDANYTSVAQFMDKSIIGAAYALKREKIKVDYILDAPSSSKFNHYYCTNLSNKLGVEYRMGFFKRNMLNVVIDEDLMRKRGINEDKIYEAKVTVKSAVLAEIVSFMNNEVEAFVDENYEGLSKISLIRYGRDKISKPLLVDIIRELSFNALTKAIKERPSELGELPKYIINNFGNYNLDMKSNKFDIEHITSEFKKRVGTSMGKSYRALLYSIMEIVNTYSEQLLTNGVRLPSKSKFKVTDLDSNIRPYIKNAYVVADSEMAHNKNGILDKLRATLQNKHFLIVDEDMDSGATLQLLINALKDKQLECGDGNARYIADEQITCLVNGVKL